ncbi:MAG: YIP1 family protein [Christensenellales bacterium]|jgi:putative uncharacterized protein (fragment)|nr:MAG: hypothetical protein DBX45_08960 [Oscillospiraceae bacterium]
MQKKKKIRVAFLMLAILMLVTSVLPVFAASSYQTYTYTTFGISAPSPDAYTPYKTYHAKDIGLAGANLDNLTDIEVDDKNNVYLADPGNNRILILDPYLQYKSAIQTFVNEEGIRDKLAEPNGVFVTAEKIFVADTNNSRIVVFDRNGSFLYQLREPQSTVFPTGSIYKPIAIAVDNAERIYVVSSTTYMGVIVLDSQGEFQNFIGSQTVSVSALELMWRSFMSAKQRALTKKNVSTEYNNITIDEDGFVYVTTSSIKEESQYTSIKGDTTYAPVKKLNASGTDVMTHNGFFGPYGEVATKAIGRSTNETGVSRVVDAAVGPEGTWSLIDDKRSRVYTYDDSGNLLFAFGAKGQMLGNLSTVSGITYQDSKILLLDKSDASITVFNRTEYGDVLISALQHNNDRQYDLAVSDWETILQYNNNFDTAYIGIGQSYFRSGNWSKAMEYFSFAADTDNYNNAFKMWRQEWISKYALVIPVVIIVFFVLLAKYFKWAGKVNKAATLKRGRRTYKEELLYSAHLIFHPFDGFWDLKHENRGSVRGALTFIGLTIVSFCFKYAGINVFFEIIGVMLPIMLFVTANWCLTTLFEGEGSFKDIFVATGYAVAPLPFMTILSTALANVLTAEESGILTMINNIAYVWVGILLFFGVMITHDYQLGKNILTIIGTIVGMIVIVFLVALFATLIGKIISFISNIITELSFRT